MSNWKAGDIAILAKAIEPSRIGREVELLEPYVCPVDGAGWLIDIPGDPSLDGDWFVPVSWLRKRKPPASPFSFQEIIALCNDKTITDPLTKPLARERLKGILQPFDNFFERAPK